jgi:hypothetical protein
MIRLKVTGLKPTSVILILCSEVNSHNLNIWSDLKLQGLNPHNSDHVFRLWLLTSEHKPSITDVGLSPVILSLIMCLGYDCWHLNTSLVSHMWTHICDTNLVFRSQQPQPKHMIRLKVTGLKPTSVILVLGLCSEVNRTLSLIMCLGCGCWHLNTSLVSQMWV